MELAGEEAEDGGVDVHWGLREEVKAHDETRAAVRLYWDLMVMESARYGGNGVDVNREGYAMLCCAALYCAALCRFRCAIAAMSRTRG